MTAQRPSAWAPLLAELDRWQAAGRAACFWLRDDDAVAPSGPLDHLLELTARHAVPLTIAAIPAGTDERLARRLGGLAHVEVAVHGWSHINHAPPGAKKQELGIATRPIGTVLAELAAGRDKLAGLFGSQFVPVLVPPWNRIDAALLPHLESLGFSALSVYGPEKPAPLRLVNTHVDVIDWHGTRGGLDHPALAQEIVARLRRTFAEGGTVGILTHHQVHDATVRSFLEGLFAAAAGHAGCRWAALGGIIAVDRASL